MIKFAVIAGTAMGLLLAQPAQRQDFERDSCHHRCDAPGDPEMHRQEIVSLEKEAAHAIELKNSTYFHRVYSDDFAGTPSHGQQVNKAQWIAAIETPPVRYESFNSSDIKVQLYEGIAVATCL